MQALKSSSRQRAGCLLLSALLVSPTFALAQDPAPPPASPNDSLAAPAPPAPQTPSPTGGWKRVGDQAPPIQNAPTTEQRPQMQPPAPPPDGNNNGQPNGYPTYGQPTSAPPAYGPQNQGGYNQGPPPQGPPPQGYPQQQQPNYPVQNMQPVPATLTVPGGTYITVRINQMLSSDRNQAGDPFSASLLKPLVVNGVVVAEPGETLSGHVVEVQKAGHISGLARLGVQLDELTLVDGQQLPMKSSLVSRTGPSTVGRDAGAIAGTTALGAAVGAAAAWGKGAAIGAGSGAALGIIGVLVTRGAPSVLYPEQTLTFRIETPLTIATDRSPQAFRYVQPGEYDQPVYSQRTAYGPGPYPASAPYPAYPVAAPYYYGYPYPYYAYGYGYGYPYYWGPGFGLFLGGGRYYGGGYRYYGGVGARVGGGRR